MFTHPAPSDFATDLYADNAIVDYDIQRAGTDLEVALIISHSGKVARLIDESGIITYSLYESRKDYIYANRSSIGAVADADNRAEFLALLK